MILTIILIDLPLIILTHGYFYTPQDKNISSSALEPMDAPSIITCVHKCSRKGMTPFYFSDNCYCSKSKPQDELSDLKDGILGKVFNQFESPPSGSLTGCHDTSGSSQCDSYAPSSPSVSCSFHAGKGNGDKKEQIVPPGKTCLEICVEKRETNPLINGVTIASHTGRCWCESSMMGRSSDYTYSSCFLNETGLDGDDRCTFQTGQTIGIKNFASYTVEGAKGSTCIDACLRMRESDPGINAVQVMSDVTSEGCTCLKNAYTRIVTMVMFKSCFIGALYQDPEKYTVVKAPKKWLDAENMCKIMSGHLVTVSSSEENKYLSNLLKDLNLMQAHIGYNDISTENKFEWIADTERKLSYKNWFANGYTEPNGGRNENCVAMNKEGIWFDTKCINEYPYICKKQANLLDSGMKMEIRRNNTLITIPRLCRIYTIAFEFNPLVLDQGHVIHICPIGVTDHNCFFKMFYDETYKSFRFGSNVCSTGSQPFCYELGLDKLTLYRIVILQEYESSTRVRFRLTINGLDKYVRYNVDAQTMDDVQIMVGPDLPEIFAGYIQNLVVNGMTEKNLPC